MSGANRRAKSVRRKKASVRRQAVLLTQLDLKKARELQLEKNVPCLICLQAECKGGCL